MTMCIKSFTFIFSYINLLPIPWRLSILNEAFFGRPMMDDELKVGCDFYGRECEALWFHLPRSARKAVTVLLNLAWILHFASQAGHLVYWTHAQGQSLNGALAQNVPFVLSILCGIGAGVVQGQAEKRTRAAFPDKFPPLFVTWVQAALKDTSDRWSAEASGFGRTVADGTGAFKRDPRFERAEDRDSAASNGSTVHSKNTARGRRPRPRILPQLCCCKWASARFWQILLEEIREEHAINQAKLATFETTKAHAFTGIQVATAATPHTLAQRAARELYVG